MHDSTGADQLRRTGQDLRESASGSRGVPVRPQHRGPRWTPSCDERVGSLYRKGDGHIEVDRCAGCWTELEEHWFLLTRSYGNLEWKVCSTACADKVEKSVVTPHTGTSHYGKT